MNRILEFLDLKQEPTKLIPFVCLYIFQGEYHRVVIYAHNWAEAHTYAQAHRMVVAQKLMIDL